MVSPLADGRIVVLGGKTYSDAVCSGEALSPDGSVWSGFEPMPSPREEAAIALLPTGALIVAGGCCNKPSVLGETSSCRVLSSRDSSVVVWEPGVNAWREIAPMWHVRAGAAGCVLPSGRFVVLGGYSVERDPQHNVMGSHCNCQHSHAEVYDLSLDEWTPLTVPPKAMLWRSFATGAWRVVGVRGH